MPLYSFKVQTLATRWKHVHSSSSAIFVDDAVLQWVLYCVCVDTRRTMGLRNSWAPALQPRSGTFGLSSLPQHEKNIFMPSDSNHMMKVQTWLRGQDPTFYWQGFEKWISCLDKCLNREGDYVEKYVKCNKWIKRHLIMWSYLVAIK